MAHIITVTNQKGGVGKTTTCSALVSGLHALGQRTLGIDLDPQGNLGFSLGVDIESGDSIYDVFKGRVSAEDALLRTQYGDVIPSNILLGSAELEFNRAGREYILQHIIKTIENRYDYIIIDTPPSLNILTVNAYVAAQYLIIPMIPEVLSLLGISQLKETIDLVREFFNPKLDILGILLTKYNKRVNLTKEMEELASAIAVQLDTAIMDIAIRNSIAAAEAPAHGQSVLTYAPTSNAAMDYSVLVQKIYEQTQ